LLERASFVRKLGVLHQFEAKKRVAYNFVCVPPYNEDIERPLAMTPMADNRPPANI
jgi:hypothetical protein